MVCLFLCYVLLCLYFCCAFSSFISYIIGCKSTSTYHRFEQSIWLLPHSCSFFLLFQELQQIVFGCTWGYCFRRKRLSFDMFNNVRKRKKGHKKCQKNSIWYCSLKMQCKMEECLKIWPKIWRIVRCMFFCSVVFFKERMQL